jgi:hypothetical protein
MLKSEQSKSLGAKFGLHVRGPGGSPPPGLIGGEAHLRGANQRVLRAESTNTLKRELRT